jgi:glycosyltransferase involved in cell wall biosynthesis
MQSMKVLFTCLSESWGGMEMYTLTLVKQLLSKNIAVELLCLSESRLHVEANSIGAIIHPVKAGRYIHPAAVIKTASLLIKNKYSIVHSQASKDLWILVPAFYVSKTKTPLFFTKHIASGVVKKDFIHRMLYGRVNRIFAISSTIKNNLVDTCPVKRDMITVLPNGVDTKNFDPEITGSEKVKSEFKINQNELVLGMLARFTPGKGHEEFLSAARELNNEYNNLKYLIVGEPSRGEEKYMQEIKKLAEEYNLNNIIFTGYRGDVPELLAAMDIFVFPSHAEAFGIALIEAMAMKKPSVCTNSDGVLDIAVDNHTSFLFQKKIYTDLKEKLKQLIESKRLREKFGKNARKRVIENFDLSKIVERTISFYNQELNKH